MLNNTDKKLIEEFKDKASFTREALFEFYCYLEPELKDGTFGWRIYDLKSRNIIRSIKRGIYAISYKTKYIPEISPYTIKLAEQVTNQFTDSKYCIWETQWLNEFSLHQSSRALIIIEIEKDFVESLYYNIKSFSYYEIYLNPDEKVINLYIAESEHPVVIKSLITRSPLLKRKEHEIEVYTPTIEKILVDIFAEEKLFYYLQGPELIHIYENALDKYNINFTKLFSYAKRREKEQNIKRFLTDNMYQLVKHIIE